jgi:hypothetical protein
MSIERDEINAVGERIQALLMDDESALLISLGAEAPTICCEQHSCTVHIDGTVGSFSERFSGNAVGLYDAACIARGKLRIAREIHAEKLDKEKAKKVQA